MADGSEVRYAKTADGAYIAYQLAGDGPPDVVSLVLSGGAIEMAREVPAVGRYFRGVASFSRLVLIDQRGAGLSDPLGPYEAPTLEQSAGDVLAVLDAAGCATVTLLANNVTGLLAIFFAATYPDRTASLVLDGCYARLARAPDYPWGVPSEVLDNAIARTPEGIVGSDPSANLVHMAPMALQDPDFVTAWLRGSRSSFSPRGVRAMSEAYVYGDVRPLLPAVQAPTLVLYRRDDQLAGRPHATYLAEHISGAKLVELPGRDNLCVVSSPEAALEEIQEFVTGVRHGPRSDRVLATVVFTDIVGSTERAAGLGDQRWRELLDTHDSVVRRQLERFQGREVNTAGDGFLATFDGPGRAIHCAAAIRDAVRGLGIDVRVGVHTGEVEVRGDDVAGLAVHIGARVSALADAGEVLVSSTVKDLVAGSAILFEDRGQHELKGVPGAWRLYAVVA